MSQSNVVNIAGPKVSIITVCLNSEKFIESTIVSVRCQTYGNIEYIVIDGGSHDATRDILKFHDRDINYWISEPDNGISDAFNKGIRACSGEIIGILNAGDTYADGTVSLAVKTLLENPAYDFVYGDLIYNDSDGKPQFLMKADPEYEHKIQYTLPALNHPSVFVRRAVYETCGFFDTSYRIAMDYEFFLRINGAGKKGLYIDKPLAFMALGGLSDSRFYQGYREVCRASIQYGYNPLLAHIRLYLKGTRGFLRVALETLGLKKIIQIFRKLFWNVKDV